MSNVPSPQPESATPPVPPATARSLPAPARRGVPFSLMRLRVIAANTFLEAVRQRLFALLLLLALGLVGSVRFFRDFNFGSTELKFIADFGFGALVFFGSALTITATAQLFFSEIENRTALTLLAKPVWRAEFVFGKLLGVWAVMAIFTGITILVTAGLISLREADLRVTDPLAFENGSGLIRYPDLWWAGFLQWVKFGVLCAWTLLLATFARSNLFTVVTGFIVLVICHLQYLAQISYARMGSSVMATLTKTTGYLFPNFQLFNVMDQVSAGVALKLDLVARVAGYGLIYVAVLGLLAVYSFRSREI